MKFEELSDEVKASMSTPAVLKQIKSEMMEEGIVKTNDPGSFKLVMPQMKKTSYYRVENVFFETQEQAEQFIKLNPKKDNYEWRIGSEIRFVENINDKITIEKLYDGNEVQENGQELIEYNKQYIEWDNKRRKYENYVSSRNSIAGRIWDSYEKAKSIINDQLLIIETMNEYVELTGGDRELARKFLVKHFGEKKVKNAIIEEVNDDA